MPDLFWVSLGVGVTGVLRERRRKYGRRKERKRRGEERRRENKEGERRGYLEPLQLRRLDILARLPTLRKPDRHRAGRVEPVPVHRRDLVPRVDGDVCRRRGAGAVAREVRRVVLKDGVDGVPGALDEPGLGELRVGGSVGVVAGGVRRCYFWAWAEKGRGGGGGRCLITRGTKCRRRCSC